MKQKSKQIIEIPERIRVNVVYDLDSSIKNVDVNNRSQYILEARLNNKNAKERVDNFDKFLDYNSRVMALGSDEVTLRWFNFSPAPEYHYQKIGDVAGGSLGNDMFSRSLEYILMRVVGGFGDDDIKSNIRKNVKLPEQYKFR